MYIYIYTYIYTYTYILTRVAMTQTAPPRVNNHGRVTPFTRYGLQFGLYKIFFYFESLVHESIVV